MSTPPGRIALKETDARRGLDDAVTHVARGWFPVNPAVLSLVRARLKDGSYRGRAELLFSDLKRDLSLFTYCLKQVGTIIDGPVQHRSPAEILASIELEKIESALNGTESVLSLHTIDPTQKAQVMRIQHSLISSSTAETLAERSKLDPNQAFLLASVRQLGLNLVAWNYPRIYAKALSGVGKAEGDLEELLMKTLGYSPLELGVKAALDWCKHPDTRAVLLGDSFAGTLEDGQPISKHAERFRQFCEAGETLAQVHNPDYFPRAVARWQSTAREITRQLGENGLQLIQGRVEQYGSAYHALAPNAFHSEVNPEKALRSVGGMLSERLFNNNTYAQRCPAAILERLRSVYRHLVPGQPSPTGIRELVEMVVPTLGFARGCVYLVDQKKLQAVPMLRIGDVALDRFRALSCSDAGKVTHPVVEALSYNAPIIQENAFLNGDQVAHVTGVFGNRERVGVLYLEMTPELREGDRQQIILFFKAIREALNDCLNMRGEAP